MNDKYIIREFKESDLDKIHEIIKYHLINTYSKIYSQKIIEYYFEYHSKKNILKKSIKGYTVIIEKEGEIMGFGNLLDNYVSMIFVHNRHVYKGIGKLIMRKLEYKAKTNNISKIFLDAIPGTKEFYEKIGYKLVSAKYDLINGDERLGYYKMSKNL